MRDWSCIVVLNSRTDSLAPRQLGSLHLSVEPTSSGLTFQLSDALGGKGVNDTESSRLHVMTGHPAMSCVRGSSPGAGCSPGAGPSCVRAAGCWASRSRCPVAVGPMNADASHWLARSVRLPERSPWAELWTYRDAPLFWVLVLLSSAFSVGLRLKGGSWAGGVSTDTMRPDPLS